MGARGRDGWSLMHNDRELRVRAGGPLLPEGAALRIAARLGTWGTLVGCAAFVARSSDVAVPLGVWSALISAGFIGGGLGIAATGTLVLQAGRRTSRRVVIAGAAGIPLGISIALVVPRILNDLLFDQFSKLGMSVIVASTAVLAAVIGSGVWAIVKPTPSVTKDDR